MEIKKDIENEINNEKDINIKEIYSKCLLCNLEFKTRKECHVFNILFLLESWIK